MVEVRAQLKHLRMSPKKVRLVSDAIKGMAVHDALTRLQFIQKAASPILIKLLKSAIANAEHNNDLKADTLVIKKIVVNQGVPLKRWKPAAFGSAHGFKKHGCHIDLVLGLKPGIAEPKKKGKEKTDAKDAATAADIKKAVLSEVPRTQRKDKMIPTQDTTRAMGPTAEKRSIKKTRGSISDN